MIQKQLAKMMRQMGSEMGEDMGTEYDEVLDRLESGQSPDDIESDPCRTWILMGEGWAVDYLIFKQTGEFPGCRLWFINHG